MIVGNGDIADGQAARIDAADIVIRFNFCRSYGAGGTRTSIVAVCNTGRPAAAMLGGHEWKSHPAVVGAGEIWCTRNPARFAALRAPLALSHPDLDDFCDDYTDGFRMQAASAGQGFTQLSAETHAALDKALTSIGADPYVVPSSGLLVIAHVLEQFARPADRVFIAGFGHEGWEWHPFAAEKMLVDRMASTGRLTRLASLQNSLLQGA